MTPCETVAEMLSDHAEGALSGADAERVSAHLAACASCRRLRELLAAVLEELPKLREAPPAGLGDRVARIPLVPSVAVRRRVRRLALARAATWAIVFLGAWWQLFGGAATSFAIEEVIPAASEAVRTTRMAVVREAARRGAIDPETTDASSEAPATPPSPQETAP